MICTQYTCLFGAAVTAGLPEENYIYQLQVKLQQREQLQHSSFHTEYWMQAAAEITVEMDKDNDYRPEWAGGKSHAKWWLLMGRGQLPIG